MNSPFLIGIDGGATKVTGFVVVRHPDHSFGTTGRGVSINYRDYTAFDPDFRPVDLNSQLEDLKSGNCRCRDHEYKQGRVYVRAIAEVIAGLTTRYPGLKPIVGLGMPGLKTPDGKGIAVLANGPRIPDLGRSVERELQAQGILLKTPIAKLGSDADYCGMGEEYAINGSFRQADNALYLGGGTGVADALKLKGQLIPFDQTKNWLPKSWELASDEGLSLERYISARGIQHVYSRFSGIHEHQLESDGIFGPQILDRAGNGDEYAQRTLEDVARQLARLILSRINTLFSGCKGDFGFVDKQRTQPASSHPFTGLCFDRIVIGQRLGELLEESRSGPFLYRPLLNYLTPWIRESAHPEIRAHYLENGIFRESILHISPLREAPVIGAAVDAFLREGSKDTSV
jgi:predicted NBD/HSP70 family sugar kinase